MKKPRNPPSFHELVGKVDGETIIRITSAVEGPTHNKKYLHWDEILNRSPPESLTHEEWWLGLKWYRTSQYKSIPLCDQHGEAFRFAKPEEADRLLNDITRRASGSIGAPDQVTNEVTRNRYLVRSLMEEGITSSLLEGASTTRDQAKEMLRSNRRPRNQGEQMVLNNYQAMQFIIELGQERLTPELVLRLHEIVTRDTLDDNTACGRLRRPGERIRVIDDRDNTVLHDPPAAKELPDRMKAMCDFANGKTPSGWIDPVLRSIMLHFWLAYDHPFKDGNGRCARALFYWSMLQHNYWLCQFISISNIILNAPAKYARYFLYTESDDNDLTYFLLAQLDIIRRAIDSLHDYLDRKVGAQRDLERRLRLGSVLNTRQIEVLAHALRHPNAQYDFRNHQARFDVVYQTARADLLDLEDKGLLEKRKIGRRFYFYPADDLERRLSNT